ncbi:MAG: tRNA preQ1(34) S-adenosylmethionine ribosyltransferase-isomerase QueA [Candidatus Omnitrophota bacterium]
MKVSEFSYYLPKELIASHPLKERDAARLMVVDRPSGEISGKVFRDIVKYIKKGDCLVINDTRVIPARLYGKRKTGGKVEIFLIDPFSDPPTALVKPSKKIVSGEEIELENGAIAIVLDKAEVGRYVKFSLPVEDILKSGHVPLPPYIDRTDTPSDREDYQTVYSSSPGATASPTAGLHFTKELIGTLEENGVKIARLTLHTNYGTFSPVKTDNVEDHKMHGEYYELKEEAADTINSVRSSGNRVFAVGTTSVRALETSVLSGGKAGASSGKSKLFIYPGYRFRIVDGMITNFHLPESTLLMMVSAFAGSGLVRKAYEKAVNERYRFFSYGDAMLIM